MFAQYTYATVAGKERSFRNFHWFRYASCFQAQPAAAQLGHRVRRPSVVRIREERGFTQVELASKIGS